jgi:hypothetical protein
MAEFQIDASTVIKKYQEQLSQIMHGNILLQTQVETLQAQVDSLQASLAQAQHTNGGASSTDLKDLEVLKAESQRSSD